MSSKLVLSRPFFTSQEIKKLQVKTIKDRKNYNGRKIVIFRYLQEILINFKFPRKTLEAAMYLYQRYYLFHEFNVAEIFEVAIASLYLSCKQVETMKKLNEIVPFCLELKQIYSQNNVSTSSINYDLEIVKKSLNKFELEILNSVSFDCRIFDLNLSVDSLIIKFSRVCQISEKSSYMAWVMGLDALKLEILLSFPVHVIALACLVIVQELDHIADASSTDLYLLKQEESPLAVQLMGDIGVNKNNLLLCSSNILNFYTKAFDDCDLKKTFVNCDLEDLKKVQGKVMTSSPTPVNDAVRERDTRAAHDDSNEDEFLETRYVVNRRYYDGEEQLINKKKQRQRF